jgi:DNA-binding MarR family transcriptional regulator
MKSKTGGKTGSSAPGGKRVVLQSLTLELRRMSAQGVLLSEAVARRVGLSGSDLECLDFIVMAGAQAITPSELAAATGLTSGAITGLVDRLEQAKFVRREPDPTDRRKLRLVAIEENVRRISEHYEGLGQRAEALWSGFTEQELQTVLKFVRQTVALSKEEIGRIRALPVR